MKAEKDKSVSAALAQLVLDIRAAKVTADNRNKIRQHLLDSIAASFVGGKSGVFKDLVEMAALDKGKDHSAGRSARDLQEIAKLWAFAINGSVFEDGSREGACHPAAAIMPVILAFSEGKSWDQIDKAIITGYDVMVRLARSGNPQFARKGFHATAITAPFGAAAALAQLLGYDRNRIENALCLAAMGGSGLMASFKLGSTQPLQVSWGVGNGVAAALLAGKGQNGYPAIIEEGFFPAYLGADGTASLLQDLENEYAISGCYLKPYPGCRHMHSSLYAFDDLAKEHDFSSGEIKRISVGTYRVAIDTGIETLNRRGDAYFNIPYAIAARSVLGGSTYNDFDEANFINKDIVALMKKITVSTDAQIEANYPGKRGTNLEVELISGKVLSKTVQYPLGEPENPVSAASTREKLSAAAGELLTAAEKELMGMILPAVGNDVPLHMVAGIMLDRLVFL